MIAMGCLVLAFCMNSVIIHPVFAAYTEIEDPKPTQVMECIIKVLTDAMSKPRSSAVSQECLDVLSRDKTIASILQSQNLLRELQEVAIQGARETSPQQLQMDTERGGNWVTSKPGIELAADQAVLGDLGEEDSGRWREGGGMAMGHMERLESNERSPEANMLRNHTDGHEEDNDREEEQANEPKEEKSVSLSREEDKERRTVGEDADSNLGEKRNEASDSGERKSSEANKGNEAGAEMELAERTSTEEDSVEKRSTESGGEEEQLEPRVKQEDLQQKNSIEGGRWKGREDEEEEDDEEEESRQGNHFPEAKLLEHKEVERRSPKMEEHHQVAQGESEEGSASQRVEVRGQRDRAPSSH